MEATNHTQELVTMLVNKYKLNEGKVISYIRDNALNSVNMSFFFSGFIQELSVNKGNIKSRLS